MDELKTLILQMKEENPDFGEPWQADAFVMALALSRQGCYRWNDWVDRFATIIKSHPQHADESAGDAYYRQWLACMEKMLTDRALLNEPEILRREAQWRYAYLHTPHGQPVELSRADHMAQDPCAINANPHHHHHHDHHHGHHSPSAASPLKVFKPGMATLTD